MTRVPMERLIEFGAEVLTARGVADDRARIVSETIVEAEAFRQSTHGVVQFRSVCSALGVSADAKADPRVVTDRGAMALIDANGSIPILAMKLAREIAVRKAREYGVATAMVRHSGWIAALSTHLAAVAREGLLATAWAQSSSCKDCAPFGGIDACFSTNPIALAFPTDEGPVVADFSTASFSMGATSAMIKRNEKTETPRFLDKDGMSSRDPAVMKDGGSIMFAGCEAEGYKGYALSLFNEALTAAAGGSANNPDVPGSQSFGLTVIDPDHFAGTEYYLKEMKRFMTRVRASRVRDGVDRIRFPGERGFAALEDCRAQGVPLDDEKLGMLNQLAAECGVDPLKAD